MGDNNMLEINNIRFIKNEDGELVSVNIGDLVRATTLFGSDSLPEAVENYAKLVSALSPGVIDKLALAIVSASSNDYKMGLVVKYLRNCSLEKARKIMEICSTNSLDNVMPEIMAILGEQSAPELEGPTK